MAGNVRSPCVHDWVFWHAARTPTAPAVATPAHRLSYQDLADRIRSLAGHLAAVGIHPGDRVLVALPNVPSTIAASLAVQMLGGTAVEVNHEWGADVLADIANRSHVRAAFVWARDAARWDAIVPVTAIDRLWVVRQGPAASWDQGRVGDVPTVSIGEDGTVDPAQGGAWLEQGVDPRTDAANLVLFTSGSTGRPHGVVQTVGNVDANTRSIVEYLGLTAGDRALLTMPIYYCYGRSVLQTHLFAGGSIFLDNRFAYPRVVMETLAAEQCTGMAGVPLTFEIIRRQVDVGSIVFPRLRYLTQAGGAMAPDTIDWVREAFAPAKLFVMYGQTEATARLSYLPPERAVDKRGSIGIAIPGVELRVVDETASELAAGEVGELVARGPNVTPGYLDEPDATAAILHDGWLWTGDLACRDADGYFFHRGRVKDILKIGGHRVSPIEIEQTVERHPAIAEAAVIGVRDALMGQVPVAFVVPRPGMAAAPGELGAFCRERMAARQVPVAFVLVESLPRNESGKLLRSELPVPDLASSPAPAGASLPARG